MHSPIIYEVNVRDDWGLTVVYANKVANASFLATTSGQCLDSKDDNGSYDLRFVFS